MEFLPFFRNLLAVFMLEKLNSSSGIFKYAHALEDVCQGRIKIDDYLKNKIKFSQQKEK